MFWIQFALVLGAILPDEVEAKASHPVVLRLARGQRQHLQPDTHPVFAAAQPGDSLTCQRAGHVHSASGQVLLNAL